ncbi:MAG: hypothetical protein ACR2NO_01690 [Chloroflexota bacterium]
MSDPTLTGLTRRVSSVGALAAIACSPQAPRLAAFSAGPPPRDRAAVLQTLLPGQPVPPLGTPESPWHVAAEPPAEVRLDGDALVVRTEPGRRAFASPRAPLAPLEYAPPRFVEELSWVGRVTVLAGQRFFILCELRFAGEPGAVLIQPTPFDLQVTDDPERPAGGSSVSISRLLGDGREYSYRLRGTEQRLELFLNGAPIWGLDGRHVLSSVAFGETRTDALHGGELRLRDVVYVRRPALARERAFLE